MPQLNAIGIVVSDMARSLGFYRLLGVEVPDTPGEGHVDTFLPSGVRFMLDSEEVIRSFRPVWKPIPYGPQRKAEMADYAQRHYGIHSWRLSPKVIVEHVTAASTFSSAYNTFSRDVPDAELHSLPGTCAHFIVDRDGTIYQLV